MLWRFGGMALLFLVLTVLTQVGGVIGLTSWWAAGRRTRERWERLGWTVSYYVIAAVVVVPVLTRPFGRVALPLRATVEMPVAPRSMWYWLSFRNYAKPAVREVVGEAARELAAAHPGSVVHYLDAGFPFWDGFPMVPHWSHRHGDAIDLTFCYERRRNPQRHTVSPSPLGYGIYEAPERGEAAPYAGQDSWLRWDFPWAQGWNRGRQLDRERTRALLMALLEDRRVTKVLVELHLHGRLGVMHRKLRFQQLEAARHDDHIHLQVGR